MLAWKMSFHAKSPLDAQNPPHSPGNRNSDSSFSPFLKEDNFMRNWELYLRPTIFKIPQCVLTNRILYFLQIDSGNRSTYFTKAGYYCHEKFDDIDKLLNSVRFWIEGVSLTIIAVFGLLGNLLTIVVFRNYDRYCKSRLWSFTFGIQHINIYFV